MLNLPQIREDELNISLCKLKEDLSKYVDQLTSNKSQIVSEAYKAYLIDKTKKNPEQIIMDACSELQFLINSIEIYDDLSRYIQIKNTYDASVKNICVLMKMLTGEQMFPIKRLEEKKFELDDISARLAQKGITSSWLLCHGLASKYEVKKLQQAGNISGISYRKIKNGMRIDAVEASGGIVIPEFIKGVPVVKISSKAFYKRKDITSVILPGHLNEIEKEAFSESGIISIVIPDNVETIGERAFYNCRQLESIKLPKNLRSIKCKTFSGCSSLTTLKIPLNVSFIGDWAFERCRKLKRIQIPDSVERFGYSIFSSKPTVYCNDSSRASRYVAEKYMPEHKPFDMYNEEK